MKIITMTQISIRFVKWFLPFYLFAFLPLSLLAEDSIRLRGCRRGHPQTHQTLRRVQGQTRQPGGDFYHGDRRQLTVLVSFSDLQFEEGDNQTATVEKWNKIFNAENYSEGNFVGSVHDYFYAQSYGQFRLTFDMQYVHLDIAHNKYHSDEVADENSQYLVDDIMDVLLTRDIEWSAYDWNGDGYINQLLIVYAGYGQNDGGDKTTIWPHQYWLSEHLDLTSSDPNALRKPDFFTYNGRQYGVDSYCAVAELGELSASFGTICHEFSHCFGLPDFYFSRTKYVGEWDLMDYGNYNGGGYQPIGYSAHERWVMGWLQLTELTQPATITDMPALSDMSAPSDKPKAYLVRNTGYSDEYYIIENRQKTSWDQSAPGEGIVVFHVDYVPSLWVSLVEPPNHPKYTSTDTYPATTRYLVFHANNVTSNSYSYKGWPYPYDGNNELTDDSEPAASLWHPNASETKLMSKPITNMSVANGLASFDFMGGTAGINALTALPESSDYKVYDLSGRQVTDSHSGGMYIIRYANGTSRKVVVK